MIGSLKSEKIGSLESEKSRPYRSITNIFLKKKLIKGKYFEHLTSAHESIEKTLKWKFIFK